MTRWWRHILIPIAGLAAAFPLRIQLDLGHGSFLPLFDGSALAKGGNGNGNGNGSHGGNAGGGKGGNQGNAGGNGNAGNGNGGGRSGNGNSNAGGLGGGVGGGRGNNAGNGNSGPDNNNAGGNSGKAGSSNSGKANGSRAANASATASGRSQGAKGKARASAGTASPKRSRAAASAPQSLSRAKAAAQARAAKTAPAVTARQNHTVPVVGQIDRRPKPRRSSRTIVASGLSQGDLARLTAQGFRIQARTLGRTAPQVVRLQVPRGVSAAKARQRVRLVAAQATVDFDQFYYLDGHQPGCAEAECKPPSVVDWTSLVKWSGSNASQCSLAPLIGIIDTGINLENDALKDRAVEIVAQSTRRTVPSSQDHGTAVAALLVGRPGSETPGLLPDARVVAVDAFYRDGGTADRTDVASLVEAIEVLSERGVRVINLSLSGPANEVLQKAVAAAQAKGIVIIAAAGNNGAGAEPSYPAAYPGVIAVTAIDHELNVYRRATRGPYVDLAAPGVNVWTASAQGTGSLKTGTSYAVPFVSAAAGILLASRPDLDMASVQARLEQAALDLGQPGRDPTFGFGLVQMADLCSDLEEAPAVTTASERQSAPGGRENVDMP